MNPPGRVSKSAFREYNHTPRGQASSSVLPMTPWLHHVFELLNSSVLGRAEQRQRGNGSVFAAIATGGVGPTTQMPSGPGRQREPQPPTYMCNVNL